MLLLHSLFLILLATFVLVLLALLTLLSMLALLTLLSMLALLATLMLVLLALPRFVWHCVLLIYVVCGDSQLLLLQASSPYPRCCAASTCFA